MRGTPLTDAAVRARIEARNRILGEIEAEVVRGYQAHRVEDGEAFWDVTRHKDGTGAWLYQLEAETARRDNDEAVKRASPTWSGVLKERAYGAFAEKDVQRMRAELVQVAAVAASWILDIDTREQA